MVNDKFVACLVCRKPSIGLDPRRHATGRGHQDKLIDYKPVDGRGVSVEEAERLLEPRQTEGKNKRRKRHHQANKAAAAQSP